MVIVVIVVIKMKPLPLRQLPPNFPKWQKLVKSNNRKVTLENILYLNQLEITIIKAMILVLPMENVQFAVFAGQKTNIS